MDNLTVIGVLALVGFMLTSIEILRWPGDGEFEDTEYPNEEDE